MPIRPASKDAFFSAPGEDDESPSSSSERTTVEPQSLAGEHQDQGTHHEPQDDATAGATAAQVEADETREVQTSIVLSEDDDSFFQSAAYGTDGGAVPVPAAVEDEAPRGAAALPLDGDLIRPARRAPKPPKAPKPRRAEQDNERRAKRRQATPATPSTAKRHRTGAGTAVGAVLALTATIGVVVVISASDSADAGPAGPGASGPMPATLTSPAWDTAGTDARARMRAAAERGDFDAAIKTAVEINDSATAQTYRMKAATKLVERAAEATRRGDIALATERLRKAAERYGHSSGEQAVRTRIARIQERRRNAVARRKAAQRRRAAKRRRADRIRAAAAPSASSATRRSTPPAAARPAASAVPAQVPAAQAPAQGSQAPHQSSPAPTQRTPSRKPSKPSTSGNDYKLPPAPAPAPAEDSM